MIEFDLSVLTTYSTAFATLFSAFAAITIGFVGFRQNQFRARREYTLSIMLERLSNPDLARATLFVADLEASNDVYQRAADKPEEHRLIAMLLSYYEFVAVAYFQRSLDRSAVRRQQRSALVAAFRVCEPYITERRRELERPRLYKELEQLVKRHLT